MVTIIAGQIEENVQQQGDTTVVDILNGLRVGEFMAEHLAIPMQNVSKDISSEFSIEKSFRFKLASIRQIRITMQAQLLQG